MATEYKLSYTASEIDEKLGKIENKLDKADGNGSYSQAYVVNAAGEQIMMPLSFEADSEGTIPRRLIDEEAGQINVPKTPTGALHATSKTYVDNIAHREAGLAEDEAKLHADIKVQALEQGIPVAESIGGQTTITHKFVGEEGGENDKRNFIKGIYSAAFGGNNKSNENAAYSLIGGFENNINGAGKNALFGLRNLSAADTAFAANRYNVVGALASFALGERNHVSAQNAGALGNRLVATKKGQVVVGKLNAPNDNAMFIVGNGKEKRQNAFTVLEDGTITVGGHFEDAMLEPRMRGTDQFSQYENKHALSPLVSISTGYTTSGRNTAKFIANPSDNRWACAQINIEGCYVNAGETYKLDLMQYQNIEDIWFAIMDDNDKNHEFENESDFAEYIISTEDILSSQRDTGWWDKTIKFTATRSGVVRLGVNITSDSSYSSTFIGNIRLTNTSALQYNYKSVSGNHTDTLYCVAPTPCEAGYTKDWLVGKTISTTIYGDIEITEEMILTDDENWKDARENYLVVYNSTLLMSFVDSIVPTSMDVSGLGIYVNPIVTKIPYEKWIDDPLTLN